MKTSNTYYVDVIDQEGAIDNSTGLFHPINCRFEVAVSKSQEEYQEIFYQRGYPQELINLIKTSGRNTNGFLGKYQWIKY